MNFYKKILIYTTYIKMHILYILILGLSLFIISYSNSNLFLYAKSSDSNKNLNSNNVILQNKLEKKIGRLDPHGEEKINLSSININKQPKCQICHFVKNNNVYTISNPHTICFTCHNKWPHSGLKEHMGKKNKKGIITCLSCHRPHRSKQTTNVVDIRKILEIDNIPNTNFILKDTKMDKLPKGIVWQKSYNPMLSKKCTDCHQLDKID